jgi:GT2 family glycosyltransferase
MASRSAPPADVDIVISTYQRGARIDVTVASIRQSLHEHWTLWVLDQSEDNVTERCLQPHTAADPRVRYRRAPLRGIAATRNAGAALGTAPYILFTNDDCRVDPGWAGALVAELADERVCAAFGRVVADPFDPDAPSPLLPSPANRTILALKDRRQREVYGGNRLNLGFGHGHNLGVRRLCFQQLGGFDEFLSTGGPLGAWDDRDYGYRVLAHGGRIVYTPCARVYHRHWMTWEGVRRSFRNYGIGAGAASAKYLRCGDPGGIYLLAEWMLDQGVRQILSGLVHPRLRPKVLVGLSQLWYPVLGLARSWRYPIDRERILYRYA